MSAKFNVKRTALVALFVEMGFVTAHEWNGTRLLQKTLGLPALTEADNVPKTDAGKALHAELMKAVKEESDIIIDDDTKPAEAPKEGETNSKEGKKEKKKKDKKEKKEKAPKKESGPGVIGSIVEFLSTATEEKPMTKKELTDKLAERFKDRDREGMAKTVAVQVPARLAKDKGLKVKAMELKDGEGKHLGTAYYIKSKDKAKS